MSATFASENISDAQIFSQLDVLNEDFRKLNADTGLVRPLFDSLAGDAGIEFCLAQRDPRAMQPRELQEPILLSQNGDAMKV